MSELLKDGLALAFFLAIGLFFANVWAVKSDQQAEAEHQQVLKWQAQNKGDRHAN